VKIGNADIVTSGGIAAGGAVTFENGIITEVTKHAEASDIDPGGVWLLPGLADIHTRPKRDAAADAESLRVFGDTLRANETGTFLFAMADALDVLAHLRSVLDAAGPDCAGQTRGLLCA
jgi:N-acetylglucosamine-6-phosphate deacetylase